MAIDNPNNAEKENSWSYVNAAIIFKKEERKKHV